MCIAGKRDTEFSIPKTVVLHQDVGVGGRFQEHLYVAGFVCKDFSILNNARFSRDCLTQGNQDHFATLRGCVDHLSKRMPMTFVLENVAGLKSTPPLTRIARTHNDHSDQE